MGDLRSDVAGSDYRWPERAEQCQCAEHAKTARPGRWECLECGKVWNITDDDEQEITK